MKSLVIILAVFLIAVPAVVTASDLPDIGKGAMTIPWEDFKELLEKLQKKPALEPEAPPMNYAIGTGTITGRLDGGILTISAKYPLNVFSDKWVNVLLLMNRSPVGEFLLDGKPAPVFKEGDATWMLLKDKGIHTITINYSVTARMLPGPGTVSLSLPRAAGHKLTLSAGKSLSEIKILNATMSRSGDGLYHAVLPTDHLSISYAVDSDVKVMAKEKLPPKLLVETTTLVSIDEGFIRAVANLEYEVRHSPVSEFTILIPNEYEVSDCFGPSLMAWKFDPESGTLTAQVGYEVKGKYTLGVVMEKSVKEESFEFSLPGVKAQDVERERGFFAVQATGGVEVTINDGMAGLQKIDTKELPLQLRMGATNPIVVSFKYLRHPFSARLAAVRHEPIGVLGATVDLASHFVQVTEDGDCAAMASYVIRNNRKQFLEIELPADGKYVLWSSFVDGKPVSPNKKDGNRILLPLKVSGYSGDMLQSFTVEIVYYFNLGSKMGLLGKIDLDLPTVMDMPISDSVLQVYLPYKFRYKRLGGSMGDIMVAAKTAEDHRYTDAEYETGSYVSNLDKLLEIDKNLPDDASVTFVFQHASGDASEFGYAGKPKKEGRTKISDSTRQLVTQAEENFQKRIQAAQSAGDVTGGLPARFNLPQKGVRMAFSEMITFGEPSTVAIRFINRKVTGSLGWITIVVTALATWFFVRRYSASFTNGRYFIAGAGALMILLYYLGAPLDKNFKGLLIGLLALLVPVIIRRLGARITASKVEKNGQPEIDSPAKQDG